MRNIKYILVNDSKPAAPRGKSSNICIDNLRYHYVINSAGDVLNPIDIRQPGHLELGTRNLEPREVKRLNACSICIKFNGSLKPGTCNLKQRTLLIRLLVELRSRFPDAKILGLSELDGRELYHRNIIVSDAMNVLRKELSDLS